MPTPKHKVPAIAPAGRPARRIASPVRLYASGPTDVARVPYAAYVPPVAPRPLGSGAYSGAVVSAYGMEATQKLVRS